MIIMRKIKMIIMRKILMIEMMIDEIDNDVQNCLSLDTTQIIMMRILMIMNIFIVMYLLYIRSICIQKISFPFRADVCAVQNGE